MKYTGLSFLLRGGFDLALILINYLKYDASCLTVEVLCEAEDGDLEKILTHFNYNLVTNFFIKI
jgi:hypothetical protein